MLVLAARSGSLEREFPFGIVRQLFEGTMRSISDAERESLLSGAAELVGPILGLDGSDAPREPPADLLFGVLHGLYWLTSNLAERGPLLMVVDDAHWADVPSLRFVDYLARRVDDLPVVLLVAVRDGEPGVQGELLDAVAADSATTLINPAALSADATTVAMQTLFGEEVAAEFSSACYAATAGNPFMVRGLVEALRAEGVSPAREHAERVGGVAPATISRSVLARLARLPPAAGGLARAVAVLGGQAGLQATATVAGFEEPLARQAADALAGADLLTRADPLDFVHPVVREAVYAGLAPHERERMHARAAELLQDQGASPDRVAAQLLACEPAGREWAVAALRQAADEAFARGVPGAAATYLRRALTEPPPGVSRTDITRELGRAELLIGEPAAVDHLREALHAAPAGAASGSAARELAGAMAQFARFRDAIEALDAALDQLPAAERELSLQLEADAITISWMAPPTYAGAAERLERVAGRLRTDSPAESSLRANLAFHRFLEHGRATDAAPLARQALESGQLRVTAFPFYDALYTAIVADQFDFANDCCQRALAEARSGGSMFALSLISAFRSDLAYRRGNLVEAESDARTGLRAAQLGQFSIAPIPLAHLIDVLIERGETRAAAQALGDSATGPIPDTLPHNYLLFSRALLQLATGQTQAALTDLRELADREQCWMIPRMFAHRSTTAVVLAGLGQRPEARPLAVAELELARNWGTPRALGIALAALGLVDGGEAGIAHLRQAADVLADSGAALEHARALTNLGAALRREGHRKDAREPLRQGLELAHRCGATVLTQRARQELRASGARPQTPLRTGLDALTPSEQRIAEMAAGGRANREIAQTLFLSLKTVEMHLAHTYQKLDIHSRTELSAVLRAA